MELWRLSGWFQGCCPPPAGTSSSPCMCDHRHGGRIPVTTHTLLSGQAFTDLSW